MEDYMYFRGFNHLLNLPMVVVIVYCNLSSN